MDVECLDKLKVLWEKLDVSEDIQINLEDGDDIDIYIPRYKKNFTWVFPCTDRLPIPLYSKKNEKVMSMDLNEEERINSISINANVSNLHT